MAFHQGIVICFFPLVVMLLLMECLVITLARWFLQRRAPRALLSLKPCDSMHECSGTPVRHILFMRR